MLSDVGFKLRNGILFADDVLLISRTSIGLKKLLSRVKWKFDALYLSISVDKSQIVSPADESWDLYDGYNNVQFSLKSVAQYKYLGTWMYGSMYKTGTEKQKYCIKQAHKYKQSCFHDSKFGSDVVDVICCTWKNVAIPSILFGCESIPFCDTNIEEIERVQSQVAKFALGVKVTTPNICAQTELGFKPFRQLLYENQLKFYSRLLFLPQDRLASQALHEHLSGSWRSPYMDYIADIRSKLNLTRMPVLHSKIHEIADKYFVHKTNQALSKLQWVHPIEKLSRQPYVSENQLSTTITEFKFENENLGNKAPRSDRPRMKHCPLCPVPSLNSGIHLLFNCPALSRIRSHTGISSYINQCTLFNLSIEDAYRRFVNGQTASGYELSVENYLERAKCMHVMKTVWFSKW